MSDSPQPLRFGEFELDEGNALLTRAGRPIALPPKAFALLCALARQPGRLADKNALLDAVWGHRFVSESVLKSTVSQVRAALADDAGEPRYIETVSRRGYRFIGRIEGAAAGVTAGAPGGTRVSPAAPAGAAVAAADGAFELAGGGQHATGAVMIGRGRVLGRLGEAWQRAKAGQRQLTWIAGDAGIGKTTLIDGFVAENRPELIAHGQCVEQFGAGEPYLPVLEALKQLCRRDPDLVALLRQVAPTWLVQMPWLVADSDRAPLALELSSAGQERMVRELWELLERYTQHKPLLLVTEDLHWSDHATLRLMDHFARRRAPIRLHWIASFRLTQVIAEEHPLQALRQELQLHRLCDEILLDPFSEAEVAEYIAARLPDAVVPEPLVKKLHAHTDGLPLFVASVFDTVFAETSGAAWFDGNAAKALPVPANLTGAIEKQLRKLPAETRGILEAASVCGMEFSATALAGVLEHHPREVGECCDELVRRKYWLADGGVVDMPDGSVDTRYVFRHALYKHVLYERAPVARRVAFHRFIARAGARNEKGAGNPTPAQLASHFELGHEFLAAIAQYVEAAKSALDHFAPREAIDLTARALALLPRCPDTPQRLELELGLLAHRGVACTHLLGVSSPESVAAFDRVREICDSLPPTPERALLLNGLGWRFILRGEHADALAMADRMHALAQRTGDLTLTAFSCSLAGVSHALQGKHALGRDWLEKGIAICEQHGNALKRPLFLLDPEVAMRANISPALTLLGLADQAREHVRKAIERADRIGQPVARMHAYWVGCIVGTLIEDVDAVDRHSAKLAEVVAAASLRQGVGPALWTRGWVEMRRGEPAIGFAHIVEGFSSHHALGTYSTLPSVLGFAAEALLRMGRLDEAESKIDEGIRLAGRLNERGLLPCLLIVRSRIVARHGGTEAARSLEAALAEACTEPAPGLELLVRLAIAERPERTAADLDALAAAYERATEGRDTPPAVGARELLAARSAEPAKPKKPRAR
jgi:DNA-binding winged helix-turn-helix (wHTH) protein/tetratricopeptide (TPR) repeat protein